MIVQSSCRRLSAWSKAEAAWVSAGRPCMMRQRIHRFFSGLLGLPLAWRTKRERKKARLQPGFLTR